MPKEDSSDQVGMSVDGAEHAGAPDRRPLKRGDACLYCRKRRIKCTAEKPTCAHCRKLKRECVYDTGKPVSRVKQLEEKVAELEEMLKTTTDGSGYGSGSGQTSSSGRRTSGLAPDQHAQAQAQGPTGPYGHLPGSNPFYNVSTSSTSMPSSARESFSFDPSTSTTTTNNNIGAQQRYSHDSNASSDNAIPVFGSTQGYGTTQNTNTVGVGTGAGPVYGFSDTTATHAQTDFDPTFAPSGLTQEQVDNFDFSMLDPSFISLLSSMNDTSSLSFSSTQETSVPLPSSTVPPSQAQSSGQPLHQPQSGQNLAPTATQFMNTNTNTSNSSESTGLTPYLNTEDPTSCSPRTNLGSAAPHQISIQPQTTASTSVSYSAYVTELPGAKPNSGGTNSPHTFTLALTGPDGSAEAGAVEDEPMPDETLTGGWFDAADLPKVARDHLLDLFFSRMRFFGQQFHVPRFFASLTNLPNKRPHQCLLYAMYLLAARTSTLPSIRVLESHFLSIALKQLDEALVRADRLFDAVRASTLLAVHYFGAARFHEGWMMTGKACRLAVSCGLHAIQSSILPQARFNEDTGDLVGLMRKRMWVLAPPADPIELGERIWGFWSIFVTDRCGSISTYWPPAIPDEVITTPFPRPLYEYELGLILPGEDRSISSIWQSTPPLQMPHFTETTFYSCRIRALDILDRSAKLMYLDPEPDWQDKLKASYGATPPGDAPSASPPSWGEDLLNSDQYNKVFGDMPWMHIDTSKPQSQPHPRSHSHPTSTASSSPGNPGNVGNGGKTGSGSKSTGRGWMRTAKIRTPKAYEEVKTALERLEKDLDPDFQTNWWKWDGVAPPWHKQQNKTILDLFSLHFVIGCAWMFMFDVTSFNAANDLAVGCARRMVCSIHRATQEPVGSEFDVFTIMTWSFVVKTLIREVKRLHGLNQHRAAGPIEAEIEIIVSALKHFGSKFNIAQFQAVRTERFRSSTAEETQFLENEDEYDPLEAQLPARPYIVSQHRPPPGESYAK